MPDYNFLNFSPVEFEDLSRDLLQEELKIRLESFTSGRDKGIDLRYSKDNKNLIVQCKRYQKFLDLKFNLKKEIKKIIILPEQPSRYILTTSVGLTAENKKEIKTILSPYIKNYSDIYSRNDLNNLLGLYPSVERKHFKLWLSSANIISRIQHSKIYNQTSFEEDIISRNIKIYVQNASFNEALEIIEKNNFVVISGIPGIGKTTLARILVYNYLASGFEEFILLSENIGEGYKLYDKNKKQIFLFDDFLGRRNFFKANFASNEDIRIIRFIEKINESKNKILILTTREYILNQAKLTIESFDFFSINKCCIIDLSKYTKLVKAIILYNHLYFSELNKNYITDILKKNRFLEIIKHPNYSPRIIETITREEVWKSISPDEFFRKFKNFLDYPESIWKFSYENQISDLSKCILAVLVTTDTPIFLNDLLLATQNFAKVHSTKYGVTYSSFKFEQSIKELENCFLISKKDDRNNILIEFQNTSIQDFLVKYLKNKRDLIIDIISSSIFLNQLLEIFTNYEAEKQEIYLNDEIFSILIPKVINDFDYLNFSKLILIHSFDSSERFWMKLSSLDLVKLNHIAKKIDYKKYLKLRDFIIKRFNNIIPIDLSQDEIESYVDLLKKFKKDIAINKENMMRELFDSLSWTSDILEFIKIENIFDQEYKIFIKTIDFDNKVGDIVWSEIDSISPDGLEGLKYDVEALQEICNCDLSYYLAEIDEKLMDENEASAKDSYDQRYEKTSANSNDVSDNKLIDLFSSLKK